MLAAISLLVGVVVGLVVLLIGRRRDDEGRLVFGAPWLKWVTLGFGVTAVVVLAAGLVGSTALLPLTASITLAVASAELGLGQLITGGRHWAVWCGLVPGALAVAFWIAFAVGEVVSPH